MKAILKITLFVVCFVFFVAIPQTTFVAYASAGSIMLYPNPGIDMLTISINKETNATFNYKVVNNLGQTILQGDFNVGENTLNIANLQKGIYFINITNNTTNETYKFVKH